MIKLMLNLQKFNNYAFFCPVSRLHLTVSSPVGFSNEVTPAILKALRAKTILDVDGVIDIEAGTVKVAKQAAPAQKAEPVAEPKVEPVTEPVQEKAPEPKSAESDEKADDKPKKVNNNKKTTKTEADAE